MGIASEPQVGMYAVARAWSIQATTAVEEVWCPTKQNEEEDEDSQLVKAIQYWYAQAGRCQINTEDSRGLEVVAAASLYG